MQFTCNKNLLTGDLSSLAFPDKLAWIGEEYGAAGRIQMPKRSGAHSRYLNNPTPQM
jgi:hypothetical protein